MTHTHPFVPPPVTILRRRAVQARTGLSRSTIYRRAAEGTFPQPVHLGGTTVGWIEAEVQSWLEEQIVLSRGMPPPS